MTDVPPDFQVRAAERLGADGAAVLLARVEHSLADARDALARVYATSLDVDALVRRLLDRVLHAAAARPPDLRLLDHRREIDPTWFQHERMVGYVCYVDRFAGRLADVAAHLDYLGELGVRYLHLMPLLRTRPGDNDGGYAVADYREVEPRLGTMEELERLAAALRARGMSLCVDLVLNHTAREHEWARRAMAGSAEHRARYHVFPDRDLPDAYERTLLEVFPEFAPGNFTWVSELDGWVWTTFHEYQWDLDYANPVVFEEMLDVMLFLANRGVEVLRLDAVPFLWKRLGTDCQNQPEAHYLLQAFRALVRMAAPATIAKAEAIVPPDLLVPYLGHHDQYRPECDLAYHNQLMVMLWSGLASRDARLMAAALARMPPAPPPTSWVTYVRCHDDIGWAVTDDDAAAVGLDAFSHRRFLSDFYSGRFPGSFADGILFQENPLTGDARISGTAAALCGIERARRAGDAVALDAGIRRLILLHAVTYSYGGIPLLYMGDELGLPDDHTYRDDPATSDDNRWAHRPWMDWDVAARRHDPATVEGRVSAALAGLARARASLPALRGGGVTSPLWTDSAAVLAYRRRHPRSLPFMALVNLADGRQAVNAGVLAAAGLSDHPRVVASSDGHSLDLRDDRIHLPGLGFVWLSAE